MDRLAAPSLATSLVLAVSAAFAAESAAPRCMPLAAPVAFLDVPPRSYQEFCSRNADSCDLNGPSIVEWTPALFELLQKTNAAVNSAISFVPDAENSGLDDDWDYPKDGKGDCEDFALEKRRLLVEGGLPSASLTCGIAIHEVQLFPHAVLFVETTVGTFILDNLYDDVLCWDAVPYFYIRREQPDGGWVRFQQP